MPTQTKIRVKNRFFYEILTFQLLYERVTPNAPQSPITREMIPVLPRQKIYFDFEKLGTNAPPETSLGDCDFGLMLLGRKHVTVETVSVSHAIVVVGRVQKILQPGTYNPGIFWVDEFGQILPIFGHTKMWSNPGLMGFKPA